MKALVLKLLKPLKCKPTSYDVLEDFTEQTEQIRLQLRQVAARGNSLAAHFFGTETIERVSVAKLYLRC
jgi:hypothetical protein